LELAGIDADGVVGAGHVFRLFHYGNSERASRFMTDLVQQEHNARIRLFEEMPRVFGDALCRALAILKNCRLLAPGELFDLLSPMRLAALEKMLDGIKLSEIEKLLASVDLTGAEDRLPQDERDRIDAERADEMNARFVDVVLNERAEERFL
jgi:protein-arginine kinase